MSSSPTSGEDKIHLSTLNKQRSSMITMDSHIPSPSSMDSGFESTGSPINSMLQKTQSISVKEQSTLNSLKNIERSDELDVQTLATVIQENNKEYMENLNHIIETFNAKLGLTNTKSNELVDDRTTITDGSDDHEPIYRRSSLTNVMNQPLSSNIKSTTTDRSVNLDRGVSGRRNSTQWPIGTNRSSPFNIGSGHYQKQQLRHSRFSNVNLLSKSAPISDNYFFDEINRDNNGKCKSSFMNEWRLANNSGSFLNPNASHFSPTDNDYQQEIRTSSVHKNDSTGKKISGKVDKGALFVLDEEFFDRKERNSKNFLHQMLAETGVDDDGPFGDFDSSYSQLPFMMIPSTAIESMHSPDSGQCLNSNSSFGNIVASSFINDMKQQRSSTTDISDDSSFSFDNVLGQGSISKTKGSKVANNDEQKHMEQQSQLDTNRSLFGNIHGLSSLINQPAVVASGHSSLMVPYSPLSTPSSSSASSSMLLVLQQQRTYNANAIACVNDELEVRARKHREEASRVDQCQSIFSINQFEFKSQRSVTYSVKVFLGGVLWDMTNEDMLEAFRQFGVVAVQRPGKEVRPSRSSRDLSKAGYLYLIFDDSTSVERLISVCKITFDNEGSKFLYPLQSKRSRKTKNVQVIPWDKNDSFHYRPGFPHHDTMATNNAGNMHSMIDESRMVFLGALHGMMNSKSIFEALQEIFGPVDYVILETDRFDYPMGFGRAQFATTSAYQRAINARFVKVLSLRFKKTIQVDPFLADQKCSQCQIENGPVYCFECRHYYCRNCWTMRHNDPGKEWHKILMKKVSTPINVPAAIAASPNSNTNTINTNNTGITSTKSH